MYKGFKIALIILVSSLSFASCTDVISIDIPDSDQKLVVEAWFKNNDLDQTVKLSMSTNYTDKSAINIPEKGANVVITSGGGKEYVMKELDSGIYTISKDDFVVQVDSVYFLTITTSNGKVYRSKNQTSRKVPKIDGYLFLSEKIVSDFPFFFGSDIGYYVSITYKEQLGKGDSYGWKVYKNGDDLSIGNDFIFRNDDFLQDGGVIPYNLATFSETFVIGDTIKIEQLSLNTDVYDFFIQIQNQNSSGNPFSTPPAPVEGNIYNVNDKNELVLGMFIVSAVDSFTDVITVNNSYQTLTPELDQKLNKK